MRVKHPGMSPGESEDVPARLRLGPGGDHGRHKALSGLTCGRTGESLTNEVPDVRDCDSRGLRPEEDFARFDCLLRFFFFFFNAGD